MSGYEIRPFTPAKRDGFLSLYEAVFDKQKDSEWFAWKYEENPYVDTVPILLATSGTDVVGARSFFALPVACNGNRNTVLQPCDTMVHPNHRRQGLFTRLTEEAIDRYDCPFFFNFPNNHSLPGNLKLGWRKVTERRVRLRIENPGRLLTDRTDRRSVKLAGKLGTALTQQYYRIRESVSAQSAEYTVYKQGTIPSEELAGLYRRSVPSTIHTERDTQFFNWRFSNPDWKYRTYIAQRDEPEAAIVTGTPTGGTPTTTKLIDVLPLDGTPVSAFATLLSEIVTDHSETDIFTIPDGIVPNSILRDYGFHAIDGPLLSRFTEPRTHVARTLTDDWRIEGLDITDAGNWLLTFVENDMN